MTVLRWHLRTAHRPPLPPSVSRSAVTVTTLGTSRPWSLQCWGFRGSVLMVSPSLYTLTFFVLTLETKKKHPALLTCCSCLVCGISCCHNDVIGTSLEVTNGSLFRNYLTTNQKKAAKVQCTVIKRKFWLRVFLADAIEGLMRVD